MNKESDHAHHRTNVMWACTCNACGKTVPVCSDKPSTEGWCFSDRCNGTLRTFTIQPLGNYHDKSQGYIILYGVFLIKTPFFTLKKQYQ